MKKNIPLLLTLLSLTGCQPAEYALVALPTEEIDFLSDYKVRVLETSFSESASLRPETPDQELVLSSAPNGKQYLNITLELTRIVTVDQSHDHALDENDFKIKDHTGVASPGYVGVFSTVTSLTDYSWVNDSIEPGEGPVSFDLLFELGTGIGFTKNLMVLEVDFSSFSVGVDIPLTQKVA